MDQRSDEWFELRKGLLTISNAQTISNAGKGLETYCYEVVAEKYSENTDNYQSKYMERGVELEEQARNLYELQFSKVEQVGGIKNMGVWCSPDGLVGTEGGMEVKCPNDVNFLKILVQGEKAIEKKYLWQCQGGMLISERKWWDLVFYSANFEKNIVVFRQFPNQEMQEKLLIGIEKGKSLIKQIEEKIWTK